MAKSPKLALLEERFLFLQITKGTLLEKFPGDLSHFRLSSLRESRPSPKSEIFYAEPTLSAADWMLALHQLNGEKNPAITIGSVLSWPDAGELELRALEHETDRNSKVALSYDLNLVTKASSVPPELATIPLSNLHGNYLKIPEVNTLVNPLSAFGKLAGFRLIKNAQPLTSSSSLIFPLLARWGQQILPSIELTTLCARFNLQPQDIQVYLGSHLRIGENGPVVNIDHSGRAQVPTTAQRTISKPLIETISDPDFSPEFDYAFVHPIGSESPFPHQIEQLTEKNFGPPTLYQRLPITLELASLIVLTVLLNWRFWVGLIFLPIPPLMAFSLQSWHLVVPLLVVLLLFVLIFSCLKNQSLRKEEASGEKLRGAV